MPLGDVAYVNDALDAVVDSWPATGGTYRLYVSDPALAYDPADLSTLTAVELTSDGGYAPVVFDAADWAAAADGAKATTAPVSFGTSTAAYSDTAAFWGIVDGDGLLVYSDFLDDPIDVDDTDTAVAFTPAILFADGE